MLYKGVGAVALLSLGFLTLSGFKGNEGAIAVAGTYDLKLSDEAVSLCEWLQASVPAGRLMLSDDGDYRLERYVEGRRMISEGDFDVHGRDIVLNKGNRRKTLRGQIARNRIVIEGLDFEKSGSAEEGDPEQPVFREPAPVPIPRNPEPIRPSAVREFSPVGHWVVQNANGRVDESIHFDLTFDHRFSFSGMGGTSQGTWQLQDDRIILKYEQVDGKPVDFAYNGRAYVEGEGFRIDNFWYVRD